VIASLVNQGSGFLEVRLGRDAVTVGEGVARGDEVVVDDAQPDAGATSDAEGFVEVARGGPRKEGAGKKVELCRTAEEIDGLVEVASGFGGAGWVGTAERKVIEADG
jgi:hypothetical protein